MMGGDNPVLLRSDRTVLGLASRCVRLKDDAIIEAVKRVVVLGPGGAGKSVFAGRLGEATGLPVVELDQHFWKVGLVPTPADEWVALQQELVMQPEWILDGDLGPYDVVDVRISAADTVILLDFSRWRCAWQALRRSRVNADRKGEHLRPRTR
jgi:adenylate kinase family enzyme